MQLDARTVFAAASIAVTVGTGACHVNNTFVRMQERLTHLEEKVKTLDESRAFFHGEAGPR